MFHELTLGESMETGTQRVMSLEERMLLAKNQETGLEVYRVDLAQWMVYRTGVRLTATMDLPLDYAIGRRVIWVKTGDGNFFFPAWGNYGLMEREAFCSQYDRIPSTLESVFYAIDPNNRKSVYVVEKRVYSVKPEAVFSLVAGFDDRFPVYVVSDQKELVEVIYGGKCYHSTNSDFLALARGMRNTKWSPLVDLLFL